MKNATPAPNTHPVKIRCTGHVHSIELEPSTCGSHSLDLHVPAGVARRLYRLMVERFPDGHSPEFVITVEEVVQGKEPPGT